MRPGDIQIYILDNGLKKTTMVIRNHDHAHEDNIDIKISDVIS